MKQSFQIKAALLLAGISLLCLPACNDDDDDNAGGNGDNIGDVYADHLDTPWEMMFAPDGRLFVTQRPGSVAVVENGQSRVWLALDSVVQEVGESGLLGMTLDPDFNNNHYIYLGYTYAASKGPLKLVNKLVRYREQGGQPVWDNVLLDGIPGNFIHNSGPLEFGPDGKLYWAVGDRYEPQLAQHTEELNGKILRLNPDGSIPEDNPLGESYIYSLGHRNPQGLAFQPGTNALWSTEHGPSDEQGCCMDEINHIEAGKNYGWPVIRGGQQMAGYVSPVRYSGDTVTWAPTGGVFLRQGDWQGSMLFTGLRGQALYRVVFSPSDPNAIVSVERYLYQAFGRLRNVVEGSDGKIYIAVSNQDGRGDPRSDDDRIVVLTVDEIRQHRNDLPNP